jgi:hypothetical protein
MNRVTITAADHTSDEKPVVECAGRIADLVAAALRQGNRVTISFRGVRGASSSYFNVILAAAVGVVGNKVIDDFLSVETETATQLTVYERSLAAFKVSGAA